MSGEKFLIQFNREAERDLEFLPKESRVRILEEIQRYLSTLPFRPVKTRIKRMSGFSPTLYRLRVGDYRVYYRICEQSVVILAMLHKKETKRWLK